MPIAYGAQLIAVRNSTLQLHRRERVPPRATQKEKPDEKAIYGSINLPLAALIAASVRVAAPSLPV
jgi:hypothetical protein